MLPIEDILGRLEKVRKTNENRWIARCPAHNDQHPSLAIALVDDRILMHCFGGCSIKDVIYSMGLRFTDLMPDKNSDSNSIHTPFNREATMIFDRKAWTVVYYMQELLALARDRLPKTSIEKVEKLIEELEDLARQSNPPPNYGSISWWT